MRPSALFAGVLALCPGFINALPVSVVASDSDAPEVSHQLVARNTTSVSGGAPKEPFWLDTASFWKSCNQCGLIGQGAKLALRCKCLQKNNKDIRFSVLYLNNCIGSNDKGQLTWQKNGWFTKSCTEINGRFFQGDLMNGPARPAIHAKCQSKKPNFDGILGRSTLDLYEQIHNHNGNLWCESDVESAQDNYNKDQDGYWGSLRGGGRR